MSRDLRDPLLLGWALLTTAARKRDASQSDIPLAAVCDEVAQDFYVPDWTGDGFMSSNPALHHSKVAQDFNKKKVDYDG
jgi:hypothetical protein